METVSIHDFVQSTTKYLKQAPIKITNRGQAQYVLLPIADFNESKPPTPVATKPKVATKSPSNVATDDFSDLFKKYRV